jgi:transposase
MRVLAIRFKGTLRGRQADPLDRWIGKDIDTSLVPIFRGARTLHRDIEAVTNAIELPWSNGQAEGHINQLRNLKSAMYGRLGPKLLKVRMLPLYQMD